MATLDSFFPEGATRGDGRKFVQQGWMNDESFEPIFKDGCGYWVGLDEGGDYYVAGSSEDSSYWQEYKKPPKTKKVKLYSPVFLSNSGRYFTGNASSRKEDYQGNIVGWLEQEIEVTE